MRGNRDKKTPPLGVWYPPRAWAWAERAGQARHGQHGPKWRGGRSDPGGLCRYNTTHILLFLVIPPVSTVPIPSGPAEVQRQLARKPGVNPCESWRIDTEAIPLDARGQCITPFPFSLLYHSLFYCSARPAPAGLAAHGGCAALSYFSPARYTRGFA